MESIEVVDIEPFSVKFGWVFEPLGFKTNPAAEKWHNSILELVHYEG